MHKETHGIESDKIKGRQKIMKEARRGKIYTDRQTEIYNPSKLCQ